MSLPLGGVKCHHPNRLFTRVITARRSPARWFVIGKQSTVGLQRLARVEGAVNDRTPGTAAVTASNALSPLGAQG